MFEITTKGIILDKEPARDYDGVLTIYTEKLGKVIARAKSLRKITSKLAAHTEIGMLSEVRLVSRNSFMTQSGLRLADSLLSRQLFSDFYFLELVKELTLEFHEGRDLWQFLISGNPDRNELLRLSGFGVAAKTCNYCRNQAVLFYNIDQVFLCLLCSTEFPLSRLIKI